MNEKLLSNSTLKNILLVEGNDDLHVCRNLLHCYSLDNSIEIKDKKGIDNILRTLHVEIKGSEVGKLGVIVDADDDIASRWNSLRQILINAHYKHAPTTPISLLVR